MQDCERTQWTDEVIAFCPVIFSTLDAQRGKPRVDGTQMKSRQLILLALAEDKFDKISFTHCWEENNSLLFPDPWTYICPFGEAF